MENITNYKISKHKCLAIFLLESDSKEGLLALHVSSHARNTLNMKTNVLKWFSYVLTYENTLIILIWFRLTGITFIKLNVKYLSDETDD